jgi:alcohol dehydrogenase
MVAEDAMPPLPVASVIAAELEVIGSHGMAAHAYPAMLAEILDGSLAPQRLIQRRIHLAEASAALAGLDDRHTPGVTMIHVRSS